MTGDTLEALKTEIEEDLGKNITEQEERITTNSDLISTVTDEVAKNKVDVRSFETRLTEQKRETTDLINGVFSNLSGVLASAVQNVVKSNEAEVVRQRQQVQEQDGRMKDALEEFKTEMMKKMEEMFAGQNGKILQQSNKIADQDETIAAQSQKIRQQGEKIAVQEEKIAQQNLNILKQNEDIRNQEKKIEEEVGKIKVQDEKIGCQNEKIAAQGVKIADFWSMSQKLMESFKSDIRKNDKNTSKMNESISKLNEIELELWYNMTEKFEEQDMKIAEYNQTIEETIEDFETYVMEELQHMSVEQEKLVANITEVASVVKTLDRRFELKGILGDFLLKLPFRFPNNV